MRRDPLQTQGGRQSSIAQPHIFVACFTTCWARVRLYKTLDFLQDRVIYFDTDSVVFKSLPGQPDPPLGDYLGDF